MSLSFVATAAMCFGGAGCGADPDGGGTTVVATTTHAVDIAQNVAGDRIEVTQILTPGSDPHDYEPKPSDAEALARADVIIASGGELDAWAFELIESSGTDAEVVRLLDGAASRRELDGELDPHWWHDPLNGAAATKQIRDVLAGADPAGESDYRANATAYLEEIDAVDRAIAKCMEVLPRPPKLVTSHDSLGYFADRYGIEVVGSALPALSTQAQPSAGETADLVELLRSERVRAVFPEAGLSSDLEAAIADEAGVSLGGELYADTLGPEGSAGSTYLGALAENARTLFQGFGNGAYEPCPAHDEVPG